jgi:long-chain acyl-CoA synthetase
MWNFSEFQNNTAAISEDGAKISYGALAEASDRLAVKIKERCLVFQLCRNSIGSLLGYAAFLNHRIVPFLLNAKSERELLSVLIEIYRPDYLWVPSDTAGEFAEFHSVYSVYDYTLLKTAYQKEYILYGELALLLTTSGSTGSPKLVRQSYANIKANTESIVQYLRLDETERPITTLPMNYTYGLSIINSHLAVGACIILTQKALTEKEFWAQFKKDKVTSFGGVPFIYEILEKLNFFSMDLPLLRTMTQAGGKLLPELHRKFAEYAKENGKHFVVMYGQTEATARMSYLPYEKSLEKCGSMGIAIPGGKFKLIDVNGNETFEPETVGELVYEGPNVTLGYAECGADLEKGDERLGILVTGDMAKRDEDGYYYIVGRKKRFLKIFGNRINLDEVERMVKERFSIECACTGKDDLMQVFVTDETKISKVKAFLADKTGLNPIAFHIKAIEEIPRSEAGKTVYADLEKYHDE